MAETVITHTNADIDLPTEVDKDIEPDRSRTSSFTSSRLDMIALPYEGRDAVGRSRDTSAEPIYASPTSVRNDMLVVHATVPIDPERRDEAVELFHELASDSRKEDGVIKYRVATDIDDENVFRFVERYEDEEAFEVHAESDHFERFEAVLPKLLDGKPEATRFEVGSATDIDL